MKESRRDVLEVYHERLAICLESGMTRGDAERQAQKSAESQAKVWGVEMPKTLGGGRRGSEAW